MRFRFSFRIRWSFRFGVMYGFRFVNVWMKYRNWRLDECVRDETCSVVRIGIECNDCNRDSISMMFVMNRSVLEC